MVYGIIIGLLFFSVLLMCLFKKTRVGFWNLLKKITRRRQDPNSEGIELTRPPNNRNNYFTLTDVSSDESEDFSTPILRQIRQNRLSCHAGTPQSQNLEGGHGQNPDAK